MKYLYTPEGAEYLRTAYLLEEKSTCEIANELGESTGHVRNALIKHGIPIRSRSVAQKLAFYQGKSVHPTRGRHRPREERDRIAKKLADNWANATPEEKQARSEVTKKQWEERSEFDRRQIQRECAKGIRKAALYGSKLERYLLGRLKADGFPAQFHRSVVVGAESMHVDIYLPDRKLAIEVDGPSHFLPIYGEAKLAKSMAADQKKDGLLISTGHRIIRIRQEHSNLTDFARGELYAQLLPLVRSVSEDGPGLSILRI